MTGFFSKLFGRKNQSEQQTAAKQHTKTLKEASIQPVSIYPETREGFLIREVDISRYIEPKYRELALKQINKEIDLFVDKDSKEYMDVLTKEAVSIFRKPKDAFFAITRNASAKFSMYETIKRNKQLNCKEFEYSCSGDERDCDWCFSNRNKTFPIDTDIIRLIEENCECEYNRSVILPVINWGDDE
ncbi:hypothetical protein Ppb6_01170 [Photorhabdus australis subsp. thailandensis]|uniref:Uncharacterized protein n=1 Tax=Photorhabdus australis subsp. thailandensis TaxID=2805096 RepID=A0A1C0U6I9_9GAMM|nr:hypothetical protein [Photorhabdus australis]OCQ53544.1 hypothetical protein Ppb6_01170 [Photorhabdus australis subsp. thailandensis]